MEAFELGTHVLIELDDSRRLAGYLMQVNDEGFIVKVTHKDMPTAHMVSELLSASIRDDLDKVPLVLLAKTLWDAGAYASIGKRARMVEAVAVMEEERLVEKNREAKPTMFHELSVPVMTFVAGGAVYMMEDSDDVLEDMEFDRKVGQFNSEVEAGIEAILKDGVAEKPAE